MGTAALLLAGAVLLTGCKSGSTPSASESSAKAQVSAFATSSAAAADRAAAVKIAKHCLPDTGTVSGIVEYKTLLSPSKGTADRAKDVACMGIPQAKRAGFEQNMLGTGESALESALKNHTTSPLKIWATSTVPGLIVQAKYGK